VIPGLGLMMTVYYIAFIGFGLYKYMGVVPQTILLGLKIGTGFYLLLTDISASFYLPNQPKEANIFVQSNFIFSHYNKINPTEVICLLFLTILLWKLLQRRPKYPWFFVTVILGICLSSLLTRYLGTKLIRDHIKFHKASDNLLGFNFMDPGEVLKLLLEPYFYIYSFGLFAVTVMETSVTMQIAEDETTKPNNHLLEHFGLGLTNFVFS
jgi:MFS superfamily sulfate permease-like transporter